MTAPSPPAPQPRSPAAPPLGLVATPAGRLARVCPVSPQEASSYQELRLWGPLQPNLSSNSSDKA